MLNKKIIALLILTAFLASYASADLKFRDPKDVQFYTGIQMNDNTIEGLPQKPPSSSAAISEAYVTDNFLNSEGDALNGDLDANGKRIKNLPTPVAEQDAATRKYVDEELETATGSQNLSQVLSEGNTAGQTINMNENNLTGIPNPTAGMDAVNRQYALEKFVSSKGDTINGSIDMLDHKIKNVAKPENPKDTVTLTYFNENDQDTNASTECGLNQVLTGNGCKTKFTSSDDQYIGNTGTHTAGANIDMNGNNITSSNGEMCIGKFC